MLGLGMDERDNDDEFLDVDGVPFIAEKGFLDRYGRVFALSLNEKQQPVLSTIKE